MKLYSFFKCYDLSYSILLSSFLFPASTIESCSRNLPHPEPCIQAAAEKVRPLLAIGDLGDGFFTPPMEPLYLDTINMDRGQEFSATFNNISVNGPSNFIVEKLKYVVIFNF